MRIAVVTETFLPFYGGSSKRYFEVLRRLVRMDFQVDLFTARLRESWSLEEEIDGIKVHRSPKVYRNLITKDGFRDISQVLDFSLWISRSLLKDHGYDVIEANHCPIFPSMASWLIAKLEKRPLSITFHEVWHRQWHFYTPRGLYAPIGMILEGCLTRLPDVGIAVSHYTAKRLQGLLNMDASKIRIIPNGVDLGFIERVKAERDRWKIVYAGRLNPHKKIEWLIYAFERLRKEFPEATLEIVGDGPMYDEYLAYALEKNIEGISFKRKADDEEIIRSLKSAWVYVLPSVREGQSITTLEAMASGTPQVVIETKGNAAADLVLEGGSGITIRPSITELYRAIRTLFLNIDVWRRMGRNGKRFVSSLTWEEAARRHKELYEELAAR